MIRHLIGFSHLYFANFRKFDSDINAAIRSIPIRDGGEVENAIERTVERFSSLLSTVFFGGKTNETLSLDNHLQQAILGATTTYFSAPFHTTSSTMNGIPKQLTIPVASLSIASMPLDIYNGSIFDNQSIIEGPKGYTGVGKVLIIVGGIILSIATITGNVLVMMSFRIDKHLQVISNYFLCSLAVADLAIGLVSCPLMTYYTAHGQWTLGYPVCQFWLNMDYLMSNVSVWNLLLISLDRYFSVTRPLTYRPRRTTKKALIMISSTYILSMALWPPWIIAWPYIENNWEVEGNQCFVQFLKTNAIVAIATILAAFYVPVTIMIVLYTKVYVAAERRQRELKLLQGFSFRKKSMRRKPKTRQKPPRLQRASVCSVGDFENISEDNVVDDSKAAVDTSALDGQTSQLSFHAENRSKSTQRRQKGWCLPCRRQCAPNTSSVSQDRSSRITESDRCVMTPSMLEIEAHDQKTFNRLGALESCNPDVEPLEKLLGGETSFTKKRCNKYPSPRPSLSAQSSLRRPARRSGEIKRTNEGYSVVIFLPKADDLRKSKSEVVMFESPTESETASNTDIYGGTIDQDSLGCLSPIERTSGPVPIVERGLRQSLIKFAGLTGGPAFIANCNPQSGENSQPGIQTLLPSEPPNRNKNRRGDRKQDSKAAKTLSAILLAFILTWAPYSIIICIEALRRNTVPEEWFTFSYYLCYINSAVNPILYAFCNPNFKRTYLRILGCKWESPSRMSSARHIPLLHG